MHGPFILKVECYSNHYTSLIDHVSVPAEVHWGDDNSTLPSLQTETSSRYLGENLPQINGFSGSRLYSQMAIKDWEGALVTIEEHPEEGCQWQYGIELDRIESLDSAIMWKRLPIHSACVLHAPIGLIEALIWAYPKGIRAKDPFTGALPLHLACRHSAPPELVKKIVVVYPIGSRVDDDLGRLPLHMACLSGASRLTFIYLLKAYPHAVLIKDDRRRTPLQYAKQNPTLKPETIELLELVHHFLEKQPSVEDDYIFEGFASIRSMSHSSDEMSAASGFFEDSCADSRYDPSADEELEYNSSPRTQHLQDVNKISMLAEEFLHIVEEDGRITEVNSLAELGLPITKEQVKRPPKKKSLPVLEENDNIEEVEIGEAVESSTGDDGEVEKLTMFGVSATGNEDEKALTSSLVIAEMLAEEFSQIVEENASWHNAEALSKEDGGVDRLTKFGVSSTKDEKTLASSVICLDGNGQTPSENNGKLNDAEAVTVNEDDSKIVEGNDWDSVKGYTTPFEAEEPDSPDSARDLSLSAHKNECPVDTIDTQDQANSTDPVADGDEEKVSITNGVIIQDNQETEEGKESAMEFDPADEAAGRFQDDQKKIMEKKAGDLQEAYFDDDAIAFQPLMEEADAAEKVRTATENVSIAFKSDEWSGSNG